MTDIHRGQDTLPKLLCERAAASPDAEALREKSFGIWRAITWGGYRDRVEELCLGFTAYSEHHVDDDRPEDLVQATPAENGVVIVRCATPKLRLDEAQHLSTVLDEEHPSAKAIILNLHGVEYIDSTGISLLVRVASMRTLMLCRLGESVTRTLESTGMLKLLNVYESERQAMDEYTAGNAAGPQP